MALFDNGEPEEFLFLTKNCKMMLKDSGIIFVNANLHYIRMLLHGETLRHFDTLCDHVRSTTTAH